MEVQRVCGSSHEGDRDRALGSLGGCTSSDLHFLIFLGNLLASRSHSSILVGLIAVLYSELAPWA
jgi:hypothetical protein